MLIGMALRLGGALGSISSLSLRANSIGKIDQLCGTLAASRLCALDLRENLLADRDAYRLVAACRQLHRPIVVRISGNEELSDEFWSAFAGPVKGPRRDQ